MLYASMLASMESSRQERAPQESDKFIVRLPDGMRDVLKARAAGNNRSMNAEIVAILGATLGDQSSLGGASVEALLKEAAARLGATVQIFVTPAVPAVPAKAPARKPK
jgi:plasmid stability protein